MLLLAVSGKAMVNGLATEIEPSLRMVSEASP
jgi:hypothetical protein